MAGSAGEHCIHKASNAASWKEEEGLPLFDVIVWGDFSSIIRQIVASPSCVL